MSALIPAVRGNSYFGNPGGFVPFVRENGLTTEEGWTPTEVPDGDKKGLGYYDEPTGTPTSPGYE